MTELHDKARALLALRDKAPISFADNCERCDNMADTIAALLAENERLRGDCEAAINTQYAQRKERDAAIARAEAAEAKLRGLCEMEPVASIVSRLDADESFVWGDHPFGIPLIPRPSMEKKNG